VRQYRSRSACHNAGSSGQRAAKPGPLAWLALGVAISLGALAFVGGPSPVEAQSYSAYSDPEKPAIAFLLSGESNAEEFQAEFGLSDEEMGRVLAAVREENETLARAYAQSEREIEASGGDPVGAASDYNAAVREAVSKTKSSIEAVLPESRVPHLGEWVDAKFAQARRVAAEDAVGSEEVSAEASRSRRCKVYASYYHGRTRYEVALPHRRLKFNGGYKVFIRPVNGGRRDRPPVKEVGPWNTYDDYWRRGHNRDMWRSLPRCVPEAQAAYFDNFNKGEDEFGRKVRNPAGVDLTLAAAKRLGIKDRIRRKGIVRVNVWFPWIKR
jgi:hypothetical protein